MAAVDREQEEGAEVGGEDGRREPAHAAPGPPRGTAGLSLTALVSCGALIEAGLVLMTLFPPRAGATGGFITLSLGISIPYLLAVRRVLDSRADGGPAARPVLRAALLFAVLFRLTMLPAPPALSDDIHRYLWDGRVVASGGNPYLEPPAAVTAPPGDGLRDRIDHADVRTVYPPLAQALFAAAAVMGGGVTWLKTLLVLADLLVIAALLRLLALRCLPPARVVLYAWNPLVVVEVAWSGHLEPAGVACMLVAAVWIIQKRDLRSTVALCAGALVKLLPLALFAPFARSLRARSLLLAPLVLLAAYWPFRAAGVRLADGLREYAGRWVANESIFGLVRALIEWAAPTEALKAGIATVRSRVPGTGALDALYAWVYPADLARAVCWAAALGVAGLLVARRTEPLRAAFLLLGAILLLSPTMHPWYLLWVLPWTCLFPSWPWILLSGLVVVSYANLGSAGRDAEPYPWVRLIEYGPFYALLVASAMRRLRSARARRGRVVDWPVTRR